MKDICSLPADGASECRLFSLTLCSLDCSCLFVLCVSQPESGSAPPVRCDSKERRLISTWGWQNECHYIAAPPCNSPQATSLRVPPAVPRTIHQRTLTGRAIMVTDVLAIWNGYSCQDLRQLTVLRNRGVFFFPLMAALIRRDAAVAKSCLEKKIPHQMKRKGH